MTTTPQPGATPNNPSSQVVDRLFRRWVSDPNNNGEYVLALNPAQTEAFFAYLLAVLEYHRYQWKLSSVCREKEAEIVRLREELERANKKWDELANERIPELYDRLAAVTRERDVARAALLALKERGL